MLAFLVVPLFSHAEEYIEQHLGKIFLQVEGRGEAWYVNPISTEVEYLRDGDAAYYMMRDLGLGITDDDLNKIPIGLEERFVELDSDGDGLSDKLEEALKLDPSKMDTDGDGFLDGIEVQNGYNPLGDGKQLINNNLSNELSGKILLQVESKGEAWYINPLDRKRYYMKDGSSAYQIMRYLGIGISNTDMFKLTNWQYGMDCPMLSPVGPNWCSNGFATSVTNEYGCTRPVCVEDPSVIENLEILNEQ